LDSGFAERHRIRSPLVVLADVSVGPVEQVGVLVEPVLEQR
jgi:hypothetical protein